MLTTYWPQHPSLPARASPLSPRSANACPRPDLFGRHYAMTESTAPKSPISSAFTAEAENEMIMKTPLPRCSASSSRSGSPLAHQSSAKPFSQREVKVNTLIQSLRRTPDEQREKRREMFMKKIEKGREDKKWVGRSDQILRSDYLAQRRRWEQERVFESRDLEARTIFGQQRTEYDDNYYYAPPTPPLPAQPDDEQEVDSLEQMEEAELKALLELQDEELAARGQNESNLEQTQDEMGEEYAEHDGLGSPSTRYGSDDEYDDIFMEYIISQEPSMQSQGLDLGTRIGAIHETDAEMMDMT